MRARAVYAVYAPRAQVTQEAAKTAWEGTKTAWEKAAPLRERVAENEVVQQGMAQVKEGWRSLVSWVNPGAGAAGMSVDAPADTIHVQPAPVAPPTGTVGNLIPTSENPTVGRTETGAGDEDKPAELTA